MEPHVFYADGCKVREILALLFRRKVSQFLQTFRGGDHTIGPGCQVHGIGDRSLDPADQLDNSCKGAIGQIADRDTDTAPDHAKKPGHIKDHAHTVIHDRAEPSLPYLFFAQYFLTLSDLAQGAVFRYTGLDQADILKRFLCRRMQGCLCLLHPLVSAFHGVAKQKDKTETEGSAKQQQNNKAPVHRDQDCSRAKKTDANTDKTGKCRNHPVFHNRHIREYTVYQVSAVIAA